MASGHSDYTRGSMEVEAQSDTFSGFMGGTKYGGTAIALIVILPTLIFGVGLPFLTSLLATVLLGFVIGFALKLKAGWYAGIVFCAVFTAIMVGLASVAISLFA